MPPRRSARSAQQPASLQSKLSFHGAENRITKAGARRASGKDIVVDSDARRKQQRQTQKDEKDEIEVEDLSNEEEEELDESLPTRAKTTTAEKAISEQARSEAKALSTIPDPLKDDAGVKTEDVLGGRAAESEVGATGGLLGSGWKGDEETRARKITETQIKKYWRAKEAERLAPRVHQQDLGVHEKILREWDMSGQYGPCIGIARLKRWKRANMLGLDPPIEVLAVLLKEMDDGVTVSQRAHVDELLSSRFVET